MYVYSKKIGRRSWDLIKKEEKQKNKIENKKLRIKERIIEKGKKKKREKEKKKRKKTRDSFETRQMRKKRNTNNNKDRKGWVNAFATSRRSGGRTWLWYRNNGEKSSRERGSEKYHRWKLLSKSFQGTREIERFCIDRFEFLLENFAARLDETKFRDLDDIEREERRIIFYPRYIRNFPTVKKGEHFFFFFF